MEEWVQDWLTARRAAGEKCLEIKQISDGYYVYRSTSVWDKVEKKRHKVSTYLGRLDPKLGLVEGKKYVEPVRVTSVKEWGNALLLDHLFGDIVPVLQDAFPQFWQDIYAMAVLRALKPTSMHLAEERWEKILDVRNLRPKLDPRHLSDLLQAVGLDRSGQAELFQHLGMGGKELVYDLSCFFSRSDEVSMAEKGQNKDHIHLPQVNLALLCSAEHSLPVMVRALPGSVRDVATIYATVREMGLKGKTLIMDRGFFGENVMDFLDGRGLSYVLPARRNSYLYDEVSLSDEEYLYHERIIRAGKASGGGHWLYRFEDVQMRVDEERNLLNMIAEGKISKIEKKERMGRAGHILLVSDLDRDPKEIYMLYKRRDKVEKQFEKWKDTLQADRTWLRDDASIFGHVFVSFLSLYLLARLEHRLREKDMLSKYSARRVLDEYSKAYQVKSHETELEFEVPKQLRDLDKKLGFNLFPKMQS
jgi:transposase